MLLRSPEKVQPIRSVSSENIIFPGKKLRCVDVRSQPGFITKDYVWMMVSYYTVEFSSFGHNTLKINYK